MIKITTTALVAAAMLMAGSAFAFLKQAKGILSAEQFVQLKAQCRKNGNAKKTEA